MVKLAQLMPNAAQVVYALATATRLALERVHSLSHFRIRKLRGFLLVGKDQSLRGIILRGAIQSGSFAR